MNNYTRDYIEQKIKEIKENGINTLGEALKLAFWEARLLEKCK